MALDQATLDSIDQQTQDPVEAPEVQPRIQPAAMAMMDEAVPIYEAGSPNPSARASMSLAVSANADQYARAATLGKQYNVPADIAERNLDWLETKAKLDGFDAAAPGVQMSMQDPHIAKLSHDDIEK
ncbi:MAG: hypothetical protein ABL879_18780, partial [Devosia sp.]